MDDRAALRRSTPASTASTASRSPRSPTGAVRGRSAVRDEIKQPAGLVHGGVYAAIAESLATNGTAPPCSPGRQYGDGPVQPDQLPAPDHARASINAVARARHRGRTTWVWEVELTDDDGRLCALTRVTVAVRPSGRLTPGVGRGAQPCDARAAPEPELREARAAPDPARRRRAACAPRPARSPRGPGPGCSTTAPPGAASAGVNGGAASRASARQAARRVRRPVHEHHVPGLERLQQLVVGQRCAPSRVTAAGTCGPLVGGLES